MNSLRIAAIGECMVEFAPGAAKQYQLGFAGDTFNTAVYFARLLGTHHTVSYITQVGDDALSEQMLNLFHAENLDTSLTFIEKNATVGAYLINNSADGERCFTYWRDNSAATRLLNDDRYNLLLEQLKQFDLIYLSGISLAILDSTQQQKLLELLSLSGTPVAFDPNYRPQLWRDVSHAQRICERASQISRYVLSTYDDDQQMWQANSPKHALDIWREITDAEIIVKNGGGETLIWNGTEVFTVPPKTVAKPKDTTGAGDAFNAAYLASRLQESTIVKAATDAHELAGRVILFQGAILPSTS